MYKKNELKKILLERIQKLEDAYSFGQLLYPVPEGNKEILERLDASICEIYQLIEILNLK